MNELETLKAKTWLAKPTPSSSLSPDSLETPERLQLAEIKKPNPRTLQGRVLALIDKSRCCSNRDLSIWLKRPQNYPGSAAYTLWKKGLIASEERGVWHTKTNV